MEEPMENLLDCLTVWCPPPEMAQQVIIFELNTWMEQPLTTSAVFIIPQILPHQWQGLSHHLQKIITFEPCTQILEWQPTLPIPFVVLYLGPQIHTLPEPPRMDGPPLSLMAQWHWEQT